MVIDSFKYSLLSGSLVSAKFILTAAHCCRKPTRRPCIARIGKTILDDNDDDSDYQVKVSSSYFCI